MSSGDVTRSNPCYDMVASTERDAGASHLTHGARLKSPPLRMIELLQAHEQTLDMELNTLTPWSESKSNSTNWKDCHADMATHARGRRQRSLNTDTTRLPHDAARHT